MSKILVTGGAGFIGSHTVDALIREGHEVVVVDNLSSGKLKNIHPKAQLYEMDIGDPALTTIFEKHIPDFVYHFAAQINVRHSVKDPLADAKTNILGSLNILENARRFKVQKLIFSSTGGVMYGDALTIPTPETHPSYPTSPYAIAKGSVEHYLQFYKDTYHLPFIAFRYANVYGPRQDSKGEAGVIAIFIEAMLHGKKSTINGDGTQTRDYIFVEDIVNANLLALQAPLSGIYNVGTGKETNVNELFSLLKSKIGFQESASFGPLPEGEVKRSCLDIQKIQKDLAFTPHIPLSLGLEKTIDWWKKQ